MSSHRLFRFPKPQWLNSPNTRTAGVYLAGALFSLGFFFFIDASTFSHSARNGSEVHIKFVDWIPGICSALGMLVINSIEKTRLSADSYSYSGTGVAWKARLVLFLGFALMAGGLAGSVAVLVLKYIVKNYPFPTLYFGIANVVANGLIMLRELKKKPSKTKVDELRPKKPGPRPLSPASSKKVQVRQEIPSNPAKASAKAKSARHNKRAEESREDHAESQEAPVQTKKPQWQDASPKGKASVNGPSGWNATKKQKLGREIFGVDPMVEVHLPKLLRTLSPRSRLTAGAEEEKLQVGRLEEESVGASSTGIEYKEIEPMESEDTAKPPSDNILPKEGPPDDQMQIYRKIIPSDGVHITKLYSSHSPLDSSQALYMETLKSHSPLQSPPKSLSKSVAAARGSVRHVGPVKSRIVRRVGSESKVFQLTQKTSSHGTGQAMTVEERLKAPTKPVPAGMSIKTLRKVNAPIVRRTAVASRRKEKREQEEPKATLPIQQVNAADLSITAVQVDQPPVPGLAHGLGRVLFNPGVYHLQDPRSRVYNFDPYLQTIMPPSEFDFSALKEYITSSRDQALISIAKEHGKRYVGSSSSMTAVLAQFHFLLSQWRKINTSMVSRGFPDRLDTFTVLQRSPTAIFLRWKDGTYAIDADKEFASSNILALLGKSMEKLLTLKTEDFERYRKSNPEQVPEEETNTRDSFHYSTMGDFLMRSQLDAHDPRLPGTGMFDLKTRAVVTIRMNMTDPTQGFGYEIKGRQGEWESYEKEYFDMIRSAFLKYSLQVRMGRMDGIFVAFHNTERIFGFQYVSLEEMDLALHGQYDRTLGNQEFTLSLDLLNNVLNKVTERFPKQSIRLHFETRDTSTNFMYIFAEPVTEEQVEELQNKNTAAIEEFERELLGISNKEEDEADNWEKIQAKVEEAMDEDERGMEEAEEAEEIAPAALEVRDGQHGAEEAVAYEEGKGEDESNADISAEIANGAAIDHGEEISDEDLVDEDEDVDESKDSELAVTQEDERLLDEGEEAGDIAEDEASGVGHDFEEAQNDPEAEEHEVEEDEADGDETLVEDLCPDRSATELLVTDESTTDQSSSSQALGDSNTHFEAHSESTTSSAHAIAPSEQLSEFDSTADPTFLKDLTSESATSAPRSPIIAMTLTIRNKVDGKYVLRPTNITSNPPASPHPYPKPVQTKWSVEYTLQEVEDRNRAWTLYEACQDRRRRQLDKSEDAEKKDDDKYQLLMKDLAAMGKKYRKGLDEREAGMEKVVLGWDGGKAEGVVGKGADAQNGGGGTE
ncbi:hypothetical protein MMC30_004476 [Trapelia coarctata]|nr:hypothetical protein [Trapelia coarctata]